jgi:thiopurine S-methyltransferase
MDPDFWRARWRAQEIGFHQAEASWALVAHGARLGLGVPPVTAAPWLSGPSTADPLRVLVPLAGKSLDMLYLARAGAHVTGVELVESAVEAFYAERGWSPERVAASSQAPLARYDAHHVTMYAGDFFAFHAEPFPAIYDRAAMIALPPALRVRYVQHLRGLLAGGGRLLLVTLDYPQALRSGPPFAVPATEVEQAFAGLEIERLETRDSLASSPRFRELGLERLDETAWLVRAPS